MPDISNTTYSAFPNVRDSFRTVSDGVGSASALDADLFNKIMHAIHQTQTHTTHTVRTRGEGNHRKRVTVLGTVVVGSPAEFVDTTLQLSAAQFAFLGNQLFRYGNSIIADVYRLDTAGQYVAEVSAGGVDTISIRFRDAQIGTNVAAGTYRIQALVLGS